MRQEQQQQQQQFTMDSAFYQQRIVPIAVKQISMFKATTLQQTIRSDACTATTILPRGTFTDDEDDQPVKKKMRY